MPTSNNKPMTKHRCGLYLRVSTDRQAQKKEGSLEEQEQRTRAYIASRDASEKWQIVEVYREEGRSGKDTERPALQHLLADIRDGKVNTVVVTKVDRLTRSLLDFYKMHAVFERHGVDFVSLDETFDTSTAVGRAMLKITLVFAELERERTSERTTKSFAARAERGLWSGGTRPLGYDLDPDNPGVLVINEDEAAIVRLAFQTYVETGSTFQVADKLNNMGFRTKAYTSTRGKRQGGKRFAKATVHRLLVNPLYRGLVPYKDETYPGRHEAIIGDETWRRVQQLRAENAEIRKPTLKKTKHVFVLTGLLQCSACGSAMTTSYSTGQSGKSYAYYTCTAVNTKGKRACPRARVPALKIEKQVIGVVRDHVQKPQVIEKAAVAANTALAESSKPLQDEIDALRTELTKVETEGHTMAGQIAGGELQVNSFIQDAINDLDRRRAELGRALVQAEDRLRQTETRQVDAGVIQQALTEFDRVWDGLGPKDRKDVLKLIVKGIELDKEKIVVELFQGDALLLALEDEGVNAPTSGAFSVPTGSARGTASARGKKSRKKGSK